jgi:hypothetical protein
MARSLSLSQRETAFLRASLVKTADMVAMEVRRSVRKEFDKKYSSCDFHRALYWRVATANVLTSSVSLKTSRVLVLESRSGFLKLSSNPWDEE